ncbi:MAG: hypothetical protein ABH821_03650 [archaeon]
MHSFVKKFFWIVIIFLIIAFVGNGCYLFMTNPATTDFLSSSMFFLLVIFLLLDSIKFNKLKLSKGWRVAFYFFLAFILPFFFLSVAGNICSESLLHTLEKFLGFFWDKGAGIFVEPFIDANTLISYLSKS